MTNAALRRYADYFESLDEADLDRLGEFFTEDVHFVDPFNDVVGIDAARRS